MEEKVFAKGYCFTKIFIFFVLGCLIGTYYEEILWFAKYREITNRQGLIYGPFSPIYGVGVLIFVLLLGKKNNIRSILKTFLYACLIGGITEYATGLIADTFFGVKLWGYRILGVVIIISVAMGIRFFKKNNSKNVIKSLAIVPVYLVGLFAVIVGYKIFFVNGSELDKEKSYITTNINYTKTAYNLKIDEIDLESTVSI